MYIFIYFSFYPSYDNSRICLSKYFIYLCIRNARVINRPFLDRKYDKPYVRMFFDLLSLGSLSLLNYEQLFLFKPT